MLFCLLQAAHVRRDAGSSSSRRRQCDMSKEVTENLLRVVAKSTPQTSHEVTLQHPKARNTCTEGPTAVLAPHGVRAHVSYTHTRPFCPTLTPVPFALALVSIVSSKHHSRTHAFLQEEISYGRSRQCLHSPRQDQGPSRHCFCTWTLSCGRCRLGYHRSSQGTYSYTTSAYSDC